MWPFKRRVTVVTFDPLPDITVYELARIVAGNEFFKGMRANNPQLFEAGRTNGDLKKHFKFSD